MEPQPESEQIPEPVKEKPAIVISIQSWATPIVGLVMLILGLFGGYALRPIIGSSAAEPIDVSLRSQQPTPDDTGTGAGNQQLMDFLAARARHFRGSENAPVTLVEFGDFQ